MAAVVIILLLLAIVAILLLLALVVVPVAWPAPLANRGSGRKSEGGGGKDKGGKREGERELHVDLSFMVWLTWRRR